jgi:hypothetical protein
VTCLAAKAPPLCTTHAPPLGRPAAMDIGDIVIYGGKRFSVRGFDPAGVEPRFIYIEDVKTGETISVSFAAPSGMRPGSAELRLVADEGLS